jgi:hypothetical protein
VTWCGPLKDRAAQAAGAAISLGATPLEALIVGQAASWPLGHWRKDELLAGEITQANGRNPHPRSVARSRRDVTRKGLLLCRRVMPGQFPHPSARYPSCGGTTYKTVDFRRLRARDPLPPEERRKMRRTAIETEQQRRARGVPGADPAGPRYAAPGGLLPPKPAQSRPTGALAVELDRFVALQSERQDAQGLAADQATMDAVLRSKERGPPDRK